MSRERQVTFAPHGHLLTNSGVWSTDREWIVYDIRSDPAGSVFDGDRIERVRVETGETEVLYRSRQGACCGVATCSPVDDRVVFIHGPENPTPDWNYAAFHRRGVIVRMSEPGVAENLDACDIVPPFTPGALRGGSHVHTFREDGKWVAFTYEDHVLAGNAPQADADRNQRNIGVCIPNRFVHVPKAHARNHDGSHFSILVTRTVNQPQPGSDEISRAFEESWIPKRQALAFQGEVLTETRELISEVFIVELPNDLTVPGDGPLEGTLTRRPAPPRGCVQRRLTFTTDRKYPGLQGPRHWLRASPDGTRIAFLMKDEAGIVQIWLISPDGGEPWQLTRNPMPIASAFSWSPSGQWIAHVMDGSVFITDTDTGLSHRLTEPSPESSPRPEACVFSPDSSKIAYLRHINGWNQVFVVESLPRE